MPRFLAPITAALLALIASVPSAAQFCQNNPSSCLVIHSTSGCNSPSCCTTVCILDPTCCSGPWDAGCVALANSDCLGYCGAAVNGSCFSAHSNPSCDNAACCANVCGQDPFCCSTAWDANCALRASVSCASTGGTCGAASAGSCFETHANSACDDAGCCNAVCTVDPSCCSGPWDLFCVYFANELCVGGCEPIIEPKATIEAEECGEYENDPCYATSGGVPQQITVGTQVVGSLGRIPIAGNPRDVDVYRFSVPDTDGDGFGRVTVVFATNPKSWAAIVPDVPCATLSSALVHVGGEFCVETTSTAVCLAAGNYRLVIGPGTFPQIANSEILCVPPQKYAFTIHVAPTCGFGCSSDDGSCFIARTTPGCDQANCCNQVCAGDPYCCQQEWDVNCVAAAGNTCLSGAPSNDLCANAAPAVVGVQAFNTLRAGTEIPQEPKACGATATRDVWFRWTADRSGSTRVETCGTWFDTMLAVYAGQCDVPVLLDCVDDETLCGGVGPARVDFEAQCGAEYLFRVMQKGSIGGEGSFRLSVSTTVCPACPADLDGDGNVAASDLALLLASWGGVSADLDNDGSVGASDLSLLLAAWGSCN
jgi:hypothetical protein